MNPHLVAGLQALFVVFLWATSWVFIKIGLQDILPEEHMTKKILSFEHHTSKPTAIARIHIGRSVGDQFSIQYRTPSGSVFRDW